MLFKCLICLRTFTKPFSSGKSSDSEIRMLCKFLKKDATGDFVIFLLKPSTECIQFSLQFSVNRLNGVVFRIFHNILKLSIELVEFILLSF